MITTKVSTSFYQDTRRQKKNDKYPIKLCVTCGHKAKYFSTNIDLSIDEFEKLHSKRISTALTKTKNDLQKIETDARNIIVTLKPFSFLAFAKKLIQKPSKGNSLEIVYSNQIEKIRSEKRVTTATTYLTSFRSLSAFKPNLCFEDLSVEFLKDYEDWMLRRGRSITTVGIHMRTLRAVFNEAIYQEVISKEFYPFGKRRYQIPVGRNIKKALSLTDIGKIYNYQLQTNTEGEAKAKDFWLFSYFANGMNIKDIALLKYKNIQDDFIVFERAKTIRTSRTNQKHISVYITEDMKLIMDRWSVNSPAPENYIFPILDPDGDADRQRAQIQQFTQVINDWMKVISSKLGLEKNVTTYTARHSFSTVLKRSGASIEFISEALGHSDLKTTESYLDSFENNVKKEYSKSLYAFKILEDIKRE